MAHNTDHHRVAIAGGGTGGHIYPALSVIDAIQAESGDFPKLSILWIGSRSGMDAKIVESHVNRIPITFRGIPTGKLRRYVSLKNVVDLFRIFAGLLSSLAILIKNRPSALFAKGGYVSVPPVIAARVLGIPVICHESDVDPGLATRINSRFADRILVSYEDSRSFFRDSLQSKIRCVGVPLRTAITDGDRGRGRRFVGAPRAKPILLIIGGSQGARELNDFVRKNLVELCQNWYVVHQTGSHGEAPGESKDYSAHEYLSSEYGDILAAADVVMCRSGATTVWEAALLAKVMILVPLGLHASRGDQIRNARYFSEREAAMIVEDLVGDSADVLELLSRLASDQTERQSVGARAGKLVHGDASQRIAKIIVEYIQMGSGS